MAIQNATRRLLVQVGLACIGIGLLAFAATEVLWAQLSYLSLDAARDATPNANWRTSAMPRLPGAAILDIAGVAGMALLLVMALARNLPFDERRRIHLAIAIIAGGISLSLARPFIDPSHDSEAAWGALQFGIMSAALVVLVWRVVPARVIGMLGAAALVLRQPLIWRASDEFVRATGDATAAYGAEFAKLAAHSVGAAGALFLAIALFLASAKDHEEEKGGRHVAMPPEGSAAQQ